MATTGIALHRAHRRRAERKAAKQRSTRAAGLADRDAEYRRALGVGEHEPLPAELGSCTGHGPHKRSRRQLAPDWWTGERVSYQHARAIA